MPERVRNPHPNQGGKIDPFFKNVIAPFSVINKPGSARIQPRSGFNKTKPESGFNLFWNQHTENDDSHLHILYARVEIQGELTRPTFQATNLRNENNHELRRRILNVRKSHFRALLLKQWRDRETCKFYANQWTRIQELIRQWMIGAPLNRKIKIPIFCFCFVFCWEKKKIIKYRYRYQNKQENQRICGWSKWLFSASIESLVNLKLRKNSTSMASGLSFSRLCAALNSTFGFSPSGDLRGGQSSVLLGASCNNNS